jgi:hypothetical protein
MSTTCTECGSPIDTTADTLDTRVPCPNCGGKRRTVTAQLSATGMQPSNYMLDKFVAHKLSLLTECGARELTTSTNWLNAFILNDVFVFGASLPAKTRAYVFNFLRRAEGASSAYREARIALIEYLETPRNVLSPYFRALLNFEVCISQCYQGYELLATASGQKFFERNDKSEGERLNLLYVDSKHMDRMIDGGKIPTEATAAVWITNHGLESSRATLSFDSFAKCCSRWDALPSDCQRESLRLRTLRPPRSRDHGSSSAASGSVSSRAW